jgi:hypothetical protein
MAPSRERKIGDDGEPLFRKETPAPTALLLGVAAARKSIEEQMSYADVATGVQDATPPSMAGANSANRWGNGGLQSTIWRIQ